MRSSSKRAADDVHNLGDSGVKLDGVFAAGFGHVPEFALVVQTDICLPACAAALAVPHGRRGA